MHAAPLSTDQLTQNSASMAIGRWHSEKAANHHRFDLSRFLA